MNWFWLSWALAGACLLLGLIALVVSIRAKGAGWFGLSLAGIVAGLALAYAGWVNWATETQYRFLDALDQGDYATVNGLLTSAAWSVLPDGSVSINAEDGTSVIIQDSELPLVIQYIQGALPVPEQSGVSRALVSRADFIVGPRRMVNRDIQIYCTAEEGHVRCVHVAVWELAPDMSFGDESP